MALGISLAAGGEIFRLRDSARATASAATATASTATTVAVLIATGTFRPRFALRLRRRFCWQRRRRSFDDRHRQLARFFELQNFFFSGADNGVVLVIVFEEIGDVEKSVPFESDVDESGLHSGQTPS